MLPNFLEFMPKMYTMT